MPSRFKGAFTALMTPFKYNNKVDYKAFESLVDWQIRQGVHGLVVAGTTGEVKTLSNAEFRNLVSLTVKAANGRVPIIAGCGADVTVEAQMRTREAARLGADAALHITPSDHLCQRMVALHFKDVASFSDLPILIYNNPARTSVDMTPETMGELARVPTIIGVKDATGDSKRPALTNLSCGADFIQFSGNDDKGLEFMASGGVGCISVVSNLFPKRVALSYDFWMEGVKYSAEGQINLGSHFKKAALALYDPLYPLIKALFVETSPAPLKYAGQKMDLCLNVLRKPLYPVMDKTCKQVDLALDLVRETELSIPLCPTILKHHPLNNSRAFDALTK